MSNLVSRLEGIRKEKKSNLAQTAYVQIKEAIIYAKFKPGDYLSENMLADVLEMSRTPVREALKELANENLVEIVPGRGACVKEISLKDIKEIYELRKVLECLAAESAVSNITDTEIEELENAWLSIQSKVQQKEQVEWEIVSRCDNKLHNLLIDKCNNSHLKNFMSVLNQQIFRYQLLTAQTLGDVENTIQQHLEIISLLKERNTEQLLPLLRQHIESAQEIVVKRHS
ncbi:MAG: GntR family transcriptional regulator [Bacillota bacterium]